MLMPDTTPTKQIAIQGVAGAFHDVAARLYFDHAVEIVPTMTFEALVQNTQTGENDGALMAIENTIAGSLLHNYNLLNNSSLCITGEVMLRIRQNLLALPGVRIEQLREVHSHPVALAQCEAFFKAYPHIRLVESADTAASAAYVAQQNDPAFGAIASGLAAELYALEILSPSIETYRANYTRFLVLQREKTTKLEAVNKASLGFTVAHSPGSLQAVLSLLAARGANLSKIQSIPLPDQPWEYRFLVDFTHENPESLREITRLVEHITTACKVFGIYASGKTYE